MPGSTSAPNNRKANFGEGRSCNLATESAPLFCPRGVLALQRQYAPGTAVQAVSLAMLIRSADPTEKEGAVLESLKIQYAFTGWPPKYSLQ